MKSAIQLIQKWNKFKKKSVGNKKQQVNIVETPTDCIGWTMVDYSENPFISETYKKHE
jgi:hypothetical protein